MRTTLRSPAASARNVCPDQPPSSGASDERSMAPSLSEGDYGHDVGTPYDRPIRIERRAVDEQESRTANGPDWDRYADEYQATHGSYLGDAGFLWGPEGLTEDEAGMLGDVAGKEVLEVGSGAGQCSRWVRMHRGRSFGIDLSRR